MVILFLCIQILAIGGDASLLWHERFTGPMTWISPGGDDEVEVKRIHGIGQEAGSFFLKARYDVSASNPNRPDRTMYLGKIFTDSPIPLLRVKSLSWRWRIGEHPRVTEDPWLDVAASVYVLIRKPSLFRSGKGFKFAWLARPGKADTKQRGLIQIALRSEGVTGVWQREEVDLCALFRKYYGGCVEESIQFIGIETDADGTKGAAEGHYADFELSAKSG